MDNDIIKISVILCTYNGAGRLRAVVDSLLKQRYDPKRYEIVIIDNGSDDKTSDVCLEILNGSPSVSISYHYEKLKGLSYARNRGIRESKGDIIAFIDDDAIADPDWISSVDHRLSDPSTQAVGGKTLPIFAELRPRWLSKEIETILTILDLGEREVPFEHPYNGPCGTNMAFRRTVFEQVGFFDPSLGRSGKKLLSAEETDLLMRMILHGMKFVYCPDCIVHHHVPGNRLRKSYIRQRAYYQGWSSAILGLKYGSPGSVFIEGLKSVLFKRKALDPGYNYVKKSGSPNIFHYEVKTVLYAAFVFCVIANGAGTSLEKFSRGKNPS